MNNNTDDNLKVLQDLNASMKQYNILLEGLIQSRQKDKLEWLKALNADFTKTNTILTDLLESRKKDAINNELQQIKQ